MTTQHWNPKLSQHYISQICSGRISLAIAWPDMISRIAVKTPLGEPVLCSGRTEVSSSLLSALPALYRASGALPAYSCFHAGC